MIVSEFEIDFFAVKACVLISLPVIHRIAARSESLQRDGFAEGAVRVSFVDSQFNESRREQHAH